MINREPCKREGTADDQHRDTRDHIVPVHSDLPLASAEFGASTARFRVLPSLFLGVELLPTAVSFGPVPIRKNLRWAVGVVDDDPSRIDVDVPVDVHVIIRMQRAA